MTTDRPDRTESPITVDKGHSQLELELATFAQRPSVSVLGFLGVNWKMGITPSVDLQFVTLTHERVKFGSRTTTSTFQDLTVRLKKNLRGNDDGRTAFALMPFITLGRGGGHAAGLIVPWSRELSDTWSMGAMSEIDVFSAGDPTLVNTVTFGRSFTESVGAFFELASELPDLAPEGTAWTFDTGLTRRVGANVQLDGGVNVGLNANAEQVRMFLGFSRRY